MKNRGVLSFFASRSGISAVSAVLAMLIALAAIGASGFRAEPVVLRCDRSGQTARIGGLDLVRLVSPSDAAFELDNGAVRLASECAIRMGVETRVGENMPLSFIARGTPVRGQYPVVTVSVDGEPVEDVVIGSADWGVYRLSAAVPTGRHTIGLRFCNDAVRYPEDRNVDLHSVSLGPDQPVSDPRWRWRIPTLLEPEKMSVQTFGELKGRVYRLWVGGRLADHFVCDVAGYYHVKIRAGAAGSAARRMTIKVDGRTVADPDVEGGVYRVYGGPVKLDPGVHEIEVLNAAVLADLTSGHEWRSPETDLLLDRILIAAPGWSFPLRRGPLMLPTPGRAAVVREFDCANKVSASQEGWQRFLAGGYGRIWIMCPKKGRWRLVLDAVGTADSEGHLLVLIDDEQVAEFRLTGESFERFSAELDLSEGEHDLFLVFEYFGGDGEAIVKEIVFTVS